MPLIYVHILNTDIYRKDVGAEHLHDVHASYKSHRRASQRLKVDLDAQRALMRHMLGKCSKIWKKE